MNINDKEYTAMNDFVGSVGCVDTPMDSFLHEMQQLLIKHNASLSIEAVSVGPTTAVAKFGVVVGSKEQHIMTTGSKRYLEEKHFTPE